VGLTLIGYKGIVEGGLVSGILCWESCVGEGLTLGADGRVLCREMLGSS
jgi:hypothetical protein